MEAFEIIDHTADVGIVSHGKSIEEAFINATYGMYSLIVDLKTVTEQTHHEIVVEAPDQEELLVVWLNELLYLLDAENLLFCRFEITDLSQTNLKAIAYGEPVDPNRHHLKTQVKAATYHMLKLEQDTGYRAQVILDV